MDPMLSAPLPRPRPAPEERLRAAIEILVVTLGVELLGEILMVLWFGPVDVGDLGAARLTAVVLVKNLLMPAALIALFLRLEGRGFRELGFGARPPGREILLGLLLWPPVLIGSSLLSAGLLWAFPALRSAGPNPLLGMIHTPGDVALFVVMSVLGGGLGEETVRAFVLRRFERYLGGVWVGLVLWSLAFGAMHQIQGLDKAIAVGFLGLFLGGIYIWRRDPLAAITIHAAFNVAQTLLAYLTM
jgi:membrane protease YdiL (CAAX protease family)